MVVILSDRTIREALAQKRIVIDPLDDSCIQPSSIDVKVSNLFRVFRNHTSSTIDVKRDLSELTELVEIDQDGVFMLHPGEFVLGSTLERIGLANDLVGRVECTVVVGAPSHCEDLRAHREQTGRHKALESTARQTERVEKRASPLHRPP